MGKYTIDMKDLVVGIGIGLCFSPYLKVGALLIILVIGVGIIERDNERNEKQKRKKTK